MKWQCLTSRVPPHQYAAREEFDFLSDMDGSDESNVVYSAKKRKGDFDHDKGGRKPSKFQMTSLFSESASTPPSQLLSHNLREYSCRGVSDYELGK